MNCLLPQDPLQVSGPGLLHVWVHSLKRVRVLSFPLPEPDLETQASVAAVLGQAYICGLLQRGKRANEVRFEGEKVRTAYQLILGE